MNKEKLCMVIGISSYEKEGKKSFTVQLVGQYSQAEKEAGAVGFKVFNEWTRIDIGYLKPGDMVTPVYDRGFQDKAVLGDVIVHKDVKENPFGDLPQVIAGNPFVKSSK
ncbi:MAG: hypothetical protein IJN92_10595 [Lachnospiraceae bacterium]|nr:hypothetical protein [Lachnospiraceae bacterium]